VNKLLGQIISTIFNPIVLLTPASYIMVLRSTNNSKTAYFWEMITLIFILIFSIFILIGVEKKIFSDFDISKRTQRPLLLGFSISLCAIYIAVLYFLNAPKILFIAALSLILGLVAIEFINRITKISIHVATISAFATSLSLVYGGIFYLSFLLIPLVAWARIVTKNHTKQQTIIGTILGILITLIVYVIFKYIVYI
jgi:membrane-associated phospholipid phosphatase